MARSHKIMAYTNPRKKRDRKIDGFFRLARREEAA
jgi:hypothetical protein